MTEAQIKHMVNRFLGWRLPENFNPDAGISFKKTFNDHLPVPMKNEPTGTNLFDAQQADVMVRYMLEGLPPSAARDTMAELRARLEPKEFNEAEIDAECARIEAMSDAEIDAYLRSQGEDPEKVVKRFDILVRNAIEITQLRSQLQASRAETAAAREGCAKIADGYGGDGDDPDCCNETARHIAAALRQKEGK